MAPPQYLVDFFNVFGGITSTILCFFSVFVSAIFFIYGKRTESNTREALAEIKAQTEALQKLSGKQIDKLMDHALNSKKDASNDGIANQLLSLLKNTPALLSSSTNEQRSDGDDKDLEITLYIVLYFYTAQTNYWAQFYLPDPSNFDLTDQFHLLVERIVDRSCEDFIIVNNYLQNVGQDKLSANVLVNMYNETVSDWHSSVTSSKDVFIRKSKENN